MKGALDHCLSFGVNGTALCLQQLLYCSLPSAVHAVISFFGLFRLWGRESCIAKWLSRVEFSLSLHIYRGYCTLGVMQRTDFVLRVNSKRLESWAYLPKCAEVHRDHPVTWYSENLCAPSIDSEGSPKMPSLCWVAKESVQWEQPPSW